MTNVEPFPNHKISSSAAPKSWNSRKQNSGKGILMNPMPRKFPFYYHSNVSLFTFVTCKSIVSDKYIPLDVAMNYEDKEFESFMMKVDKIGSIITGLSSNDQAVNDKALKEATIYLEGKVKGDVNEGSLVVKQSRTIINHEAFNCETLKDHSTSKEAFMVSMSQDAERRARDRKEREAKACKYSIEANKCIESKDFRSALYFYNKAIDQHVNQPMLYAERAKVLLKLKMYTKAIKDCDKGIKLNGDLFLLKGETYTTEEKKKNDLVDEELKFIRNQIITKSTEDYQSH